MDSPNSPRVLLVDDEASLLATTAAILSDDFRVVEATGADPALALLAAEEFDILCTDFQMPGKNGIELLREAAIRWPDMCGVLVTGHREYVEREWSIGDRFLLLIKPYEPEKMIALLQRAAAQANLKKRMTELARG
jgi:DNA-binding NtrC family response regulator